MTERLFEGLGDAETFRQVFENSLEAIILTDLKGRIVRANRAWLDLHGYSEAEVIGHTTSLVRGSGSNPDMYRHMWTQIRDPSRGIWKGEIVNRHKDGTDIPLLLTIYPLRRDEQIVGYAGLAIDLTRQKKLEEFKRLYDLVVWHDLRSPLTAVTGILDVVVAGLAGPMTTEQRDLLERARRQSRRMAELISTTLDLEKLKARKLELDVDDVDLFDVVRASIETQAALADGRGVRIQLCAGGREAGPGDRLLWKLDPVHLQRCVDNLLKNAIEAAPRGEAVVVDLTRVGERARIRLHNGGPPIPPDVQATLFHPFGTYGKRGGTGLGLYGVKLLVEAMSGVVSCVTGEQGTTFELIFEPHVEKGPPAGAEVVGSRESGVGSLQ